MNDGFDWLNQQIKKKDAESVGKRTGSVRPVQEALNIPQSDNEPKPWTIRVWRYHSYTDEPFLTYEEVIQEYMWRIDADMDEWVEGIYDPNGVLVIKNI